LVGEKIAEFNLHGAIRLIVSDDTIAPYTDETFISLASKHPSTCVNAEFSNTIHSIPQSTQALQITASLVKKAIYSFHCSSSGGLDHLRPQQIKDMLQEDFGESSSRLLNTLTEFVNMSLNGEIPVDVISTFYGAKLIALSKKDGGIRPIAICNVLRCVISKVVSHSVLEKANKQFLPIQMGVDTRLGSEAVVHSCRKYIASTKDSKKVLFKIDFRNAFNCIRRDKMLNIVFHKFSEIHRYVWQCYRHPTLLVNRSRVIYSAEGIQQGDPIGPLLFSLTINDLTHSLKSELNSWFLDDATLADHRDVVLQDFKTIIAAKDLLGLE
jgi:hypothetical protein